MFDFRLQVRLKQAQNAFRDGRLDEAFTIASEKAIRDLRGGQVLLEELVDPLLDRAADHFTGGRLKEALLDVEKAIHAGGLRPRAAELRGNVQQALEARQRGERQAKEVLESARGHLKNGSLATAVSILSAAADSPEAAKVRREVETRERRGDEARARAAAHLDHDEILEAFRALDEAVRAAPRHDAVPELRARLKRACVPLLQRALDGGDLGAARDLISRLGGVVEESFELRRLASIFSTAHDAAAAFDRGDFEAARALLGRLEHDLPAADWVRDSLREVAKVVEAVPALRSGPLGRLLGAGARRPSPTLAQEKDRTVSSSGSELLRASPCTGSAAGHDRLLLWIDGVGTYLILTADRISLGRAGSSSRPGIALSGDVVGHHAEVLRVEDDYFLAAAQGSVVVNGQQVRRKLLGAGDVIQLSPSCRLTFELPTAMSPTAVLGLPRGTRIEGDARKVILLKEHILIGPRDNCHVAVPAKGVIVLSVVPAGVLCRAEEEILVNGKPCGREATAPLGAHMQIGDLTFTMTDSTRGALTPPPERGGAEGSGPSMTP